MDAVDDPHAGPVDDDGRQRRPELSQRTDVLVVLTGRPRRIGGPQRVDPDRPDVTEAKRSAPREPGQPQNIIRAFGSR
ncbi:hypothetical protein OHS58_17960 [Amycolatopsis sp. NBC_00348]|uniref:hypothetical protein n=1 Tax=Amycolatopsis sp. NBC_00348 TaxID=2975956 RepID=UPI00324A44D3